MRNVNERINNQTVTMIQKVPVTKYIRCNSLRDVLANIRSGTKFVYQRLILRKAELTFKWDHVNRLLSS